MWRCMPQNHSVMHKPWKWDLEIVTVINENLTNMPTILLKLIFMFDSRNATIILTVTVHIENNMIEINASRNIHICKKIFLALLCSIAPVDAAFDAL